MATHPETDLEIVRDDTPLAIRLGEPLREIDCVRAARGNDSFLRIMKPRLLNRPDQVSPYPGTFKDFLERVDQHLAKFAESEHVDVISYEWKLFPVPRNPHDSRSTFYNEVHEFQRQFLTMIFPEDPLPGLLLCGEVPFIRPTEGLSIFDHSISGVADVLSTAFIDYEKWAVDTNEPFVLEDVNRKEQAWRTGNSIVTLLDPEPAVRFFVN